jgi:hypothetical protein
MCIAAPLIRQYSSFNMVGPQKSSKKNKNSSRIDNMENTIELRRFRVDTFFEGKKSGVNEFAHWKDGVQYVGTCGKTLKSALEEIELEKQEYLKKIDRDEAYDNKE